MNEGYRDILNSIGSSRPTPGGGSVAALSLAHAHSLATMVSRLTLKSDKWSDGHEIANLIVQQSVDRIDDSISLAERDAAAFDAVMAAYRLPKDDDSNIRSDSIRQATIGAALTPLEILRASHLLLNDLLKLSHHCNANALTDLAASAELAHSAAKIAQMNVKINTQYISGNDVDSIDHDTEIVIGKCDEKMLHLRSIYTERLGW
ncbi:MAG: hypothetical protein CMA47_03205 [Euryarchaeota archaeon]|nr:hypothetical protein [Euryarchaeota archaeon]|tara:strand:- start:2656 stop:3270 length:615 start_codon:yes stop_codon:yes gene_type:complete